MSTQPVTLDMSTAQPITLDMSTAQPISGGTAASPQLSPADQALAKAGITLSGTSGPGKAPVPFGLQNPAQAGQPTQPRFFDPHAESGFFGRTGEFIRGAASVPGNIIAHPVDTLTGLAQSQAPLLSGMAIGGQYPATAMTGDPVRDMTNIETRQTAQGAAVDQGRDLLQNHPAYAAGTVAGMYLTGKAISKAPSGVRGAVNYFRDTPHPQASANLAAAADMGGKPAGVTAVYEDHAAPAAKEFRNAGARLGITPEDIDADGGRNGYKVATQVANELQARVDEHSAPYFQQVENRPIYPSMRDRINTQLGPIMDALPAKLATAINGAQTVGDLNAIRKELNMGGTRFFNAATDAQFSAPESQQAMAKAGNFLRDEVYGDIQNVTGINVRPMKQLEGNAINLRNQFEKGSPVLSKVANRAEAPPTWFQRVRAGESAVDIGKSIVNPATKVFGLDVEPPNQMELFNTRLKRALKGGQDVPLFHGDPLALPRPSIQTPITQYPQLPANVGRYNFGQAEVRGTPFIPRAEAPLRLSPASSIQVEGTTPRLSLREQLKAAGRKR